MSAPLAFIDTETTSLRPGRRAWDVAVILRHPDGHEVTNSWFIDAADLDLGNADPFSLDVGKFYQRHPQYRLEPSDSPPVGEFKALNFLERLTRGAHLVGAVVSFDADVLGQRMRAHGICPSWHYHLIDVEALAVGWLNGNATSFGHKERPLTVAVPPWKSDDLTAALGIPPVPGDERHTALGDARWAMRIYDVVMGGRP